MNAQTPLQAARQNARDKAGKYTTFNRPETIGADLGSTAYEAAQEQADVISFEGRDHQRAFLARAGVKANVINALEDELETAVRDAATKVAEEVDTIAGDERDVARQFERYRWGSLNSDRFMEAADGERATDMPHGSMVEMFVQGAPESDPIAFRVAYAEYPSDQDGEFRKGRYYCIPEWSEGNPEGTQAAVPTLDYEPGSESELFAREHAWRMAQEFMEKRAKEITEQRSR